MKKRIFSAVMAFCLVASIGIAVNAVKLRESPVNFCDTSHVKLQRDDVAFTQEDVSTNFENYAQGESRVSLPETFSGDGTATNAVGVVLDYDTDEPIVNAEVSIDGEPLVTTDSRGRFQILNVPDGNYAWTVTADEYCPAEYLNYRICHTAGAHIYTFYINKDTPIIHDYAAPPDEVQCVPPSEVTGNETDILVATPRLSSVPTISSTVKVYYNEKTQTIDRERYLRGVVQKESGYKEFYTDRGLTLKQVYQLYCAQAIASNTFVEYAQKVWSNHQGKYDVCSTAHCQAYDPTSVSQEVITAVSDIFYTLAGEPAAVVMFYEPDRNTYQYFWSAFGSSCYNQGTKDWDNTPALRGVACHDLAKGYGGNRYGMCQMGAAYLAKQGYAAEDILMYYYTDCDSEFCVLE